MQVWQVSAHCASTHAPRAQTARARRRMALARARRRPLKIAMSQVWCCLRPGRFPGPAPRAPRGSSQGGAARPLPASRGRAGAAPAASSQARQTRNLRASSFLLCSELMIIHRRCHYCLLTRPSHNPAQGVLAPQHKLDTAYVTQNPRACRAATSRSRRRRLQTSTRSRGPPPSP